MKYLDLFSGIGGFTLGIQQAYETIRNTNVSEVGGRQEVAEGELQKDGQRLHPVSVQATISSANRNNEHTDGGIDEGQPTCIGYSEIDRFAIQVYEKHFPDHRNFGDISTIVTTDLPDFDLLVGGFPCQAFSIAGKRRGFDDTRGTLFFEIARILRDKRPRYFLLENVKGLLSHDSGKTFSTILGVLTDIGYEYQWQVLNSKNFGVPQNRERVFIIGNIRGEPRSKVFPIGESSTGDFEPQGDAQSKGERVRSNLASTLAQRDYKGGNNLIQLNNSAQGGNRQPKILDDYNHRMRQDGNTGTVRSTFGNEAPGNGNKLVDGTKIRRLTPLECERLQGFPDGWTDILSDTQRYKTLGNAVTTNVIKYIISRLYANTHS